MQHKPTGYLSEIRRIEPRKLVDGGDTGLQGPHGDCIDLHALLTGNSVQVRLVRASPIPCEFPAYNMGA